MPKFPGERFPYETAWWTAYEANEGIRRLAYEILEANGVWHVRVLADANTGGPASLIEVDHPDVGEDADLNLKIPKSFVLHWLSWHERQNARAQVEREERMIAATKAAARAAKGAMIAAWAAVVTTIVAAIAAGVQAYAAWPGGPK
jgi:hypothetical protein